MTTLRDRRLPLVAALTIVLVVLVVPPLGFLLEGSVALPDGIGVDRFIDLTDRRGILLSTWNSFVFALGSALAALVLGGVPAWLVERTDARLKRWVYFTTVVSFGTPHVLYVSAWMLLLGRAGPLNAAWQALTGSFTPLVRVNGMPAMIFIEGLLWSPLVFLMLSATLRNFNPDFEEASRMSGAGTLATLRRITLRLSAPAIFALAMLMFIRTLEAFEVPALVGLPGNLYVLTTDIYNTMNLTVPPDLGMASAVSMLLLVVVAALLHLYGRLTRNASRFATVTGKAFRPKQVRLGGWRILADAILLLDVLLLLVLPIAMLLWTSLLPFPGGFSPDAVEMLSLRNYADALEEPRYLQLALNTVLVAVTAASAVMLVTTLVAWLSVRGARGAGWLDQLATFPLVFPGIVLAVGVMQLFLKVPVGVYGTLWILIWAFCINYLPFGMRYSSAGMLQIHRELEEAAQMSGASRAATFRRVVLPLLTPALLAGWLFIFLLAARSLTLPILLAGPSSQTMAVAMYDLWSGGQSTELAAVGLIWTACMTVAAAVFHWLGRRSGGGLYSGH